MSRRCQRLLEPVAQPLATPSDIGERTRSAYVFGAICPAEGKGAASIMP